MSDTRKDKFGAIDANNHFDVVVVGGGINGIGTFRELALQGLRVLLVEREDFCSGCSAAPSRMIHGGLRYLENGELGLVRESLRERDALLRNAPHMVRPLPTTVPITATISGILNAAVGFLGLQGKPSVRGALPIKIGLSLYDFITRKRRVLPAHEFRGAKATQKLWPKLKQGVKYSATYYDAWISYPERLGVELLKDCESLDLNCVALNYASFSMEDGKPVLKCEETGEKISISANAVVNATGAWLDETLQSLNPKPQPEGAFVSGTKGSHLIINNQELMDALGGHMIYFENADGRICIMFPYLGNVLVGSTDIKVSKPTKVRCEDSEATYILESLHNVFPGISIAPDEIVFSYSGIRPLPQSDQGFSGRISRDHFVKRLEGTPPIFCMIGGKWTTFRAFAEQTADAVLAELGAPRITDTLGLAIGGGSGFPTSSTLLVNDIMKRFSFSEARTEHLVGHYGTSAVAVIDHCQKFAGEEELAPGCAYTRGEIDYLIRQEQVLHLADILMRRTSLAITGQISLEIIEAIADIAAKSLNWSEAQKREEQDNLIQHLQHYHGVSLEMLVQRTNTRRKKCA